MESKAVARYVRLGPRKVGRVLSLIRNKEVINAYNILKFTPWQCASEVKKVLQSAVANSGRLKDPAGLFVKGAWAGYGPSLKRMRPMAMGRGALYKRKTCHITIIVDEIKKRKSNPGNKVQ